MRPVEGPTHNLEQTRGHELPREVVVTARAEGVELGRCTLNVEGPRDVVIGADASCGLRLQAKGVSRKHLALELALGGVLARDLGSTNGTRYQGSKLKEALVPLGAVLKIGRVELLLEAPRAGPAARLGGVETRSAAFARVLDTLGKAARTDVTVLLEGETGTGKDVLARAIHAQSPRAKGPFEVIDCGALPKELAQAELFGHEKGAFTGAHAARAGGLERASGGTLFLDEIGELPLELQPLLLRALEARQVKHVGGSAFVPIDVRVVAATHRDLDAQVTAGAFRADLLHRLAVVRVKVPRLADRLEDLPLLARAILDTLGPNAAGLTLSPETLDQLARQPWPGNVRELRNFLERAAAIGEQVEAPKRTPAGAPLSQWPSDYRAARDQALESFERDFARHIVARAGGNVTKAAKEAGIGRGYLHRILKKHGLSRD